jgi:hypothetical protein
VCVREREREREVYYMIIMHHKSHLFSKKNKNKKESDMKIEKRKHRPYQKFLNYMMYLFHAKGILVLITRCSHKYHQLVINAAY